MRSDEQTALRQWLRDAVPEADSGPEGPEIKPLAGDAGGRRYYQLPAHPKLLAVHAAAEAEDSHTFVTLARYLRDQGIHAPQIYQADFDQGFLLIEHLGDQLYLSALTADNVEVLYGEALIALLTMQQAPRDLPELADYSPEKLHSEMALFPQWFITELLGYELNEVEQAQLDQVFAVLEANALEQPQCFVHRDYHSRNLIHREVGPPGVIDFQDAVWGPFTYDLVSLLRDCYIRWPQQRVRGWAVSYANMAAEVGVIPPIDETQLLRWFDLMGLQRHLKVLGIFARLALRDNKHRFLQDLPLVIRYTLEEADSHPETQPLANWFRDTLLPLIEPQSWYTDYRQAGYTVKAGSE